MPIQINTLPPEADVRSDRPVVIEDPLGQENPPAQNTLLGAAPTVIWVDPADPIELTISFPGYKTKVFVVEWPKKHQISIRLQLAE